jgi:hypothetical protein
MKKASILIAFILAGIASPHAEKFALKKAYELHERLTKDTADYIETRAQVKAIINRLKEEAERIRKMELKEKMALMHCAHDPCSAEDVLQYLQEDQKESAHAFHMWDEVDARLDDDLHETIALVAELNENEGAFCMLMGDIDKVGRVQHGKPADAPPDELASCLESLHKQ